MKQVPHLWPINIRYATKFVPPLLIINRVLPYLHIIKKNGEKERCICRVLGIRVRTEGNGAFMARCSAKNLFF